MPDRIVWDVRPQLSGDTLRHGRLDELHVDSCSLRLVRNGPAYLLTVIRPDGTCFVARIEKQGQRAAVVPTATDIPFDEED